RNVVGPVLRIKIDACEAALGRRDLARFRQESRAVGAAGAGGQRRRQQQCACHLRATRGRGMAFCFCWHAFPVVPSTRIVAGIGAAGNPFLRFIAHNRIDMAAEPDIDALDAFLTNLDDAMRACEALGDDALARHAGRKLFAAVACAADALLRDGGKGLHAAPDKVGAFFDKAAAGFVQAVDGMHLRAVLKEAAPADDGNAPRPRTADPLTPAFAAWAAPAPAEAERRS